jgi:polyisoprenyl-phosphate glycosyltransferase
VKTSALIPAYNEETTVGSVISTARRAGCVDEVIVISDGSTDRTSQVACAAGADLVIELSPNRGKAGAVESGMIAASGDCLLLLDGDLIGLRRTHVRMLVDPVRAGRADMTIGSMAQGRISTDIAQGLTPDLSGQRAVARTLLEGLGASGFTMEVALNRRTKKNGTRVRRVRLERLSHRWKEEKMGLVPGLAARFKMYWEILRYSSSGSA